MILSTLCYLERGDEYLMLHRVKKAHDLNRDKWIGVGGKFLEGESPEDCILRETWEETGLTLTDYRYRGLVTFVSDQAPTEYMHLFTAAGWTGSAAPYTQTVEVEGATEEIEAILVSALASGADLDTQKAYAKAFGIISSGTAELGDGTATFQVYKKPATDCTVGLKGV